VINATIDWLTDPPEDEESPKRFYGVTTGRVINLLDPMCLGRVQVQLNFIDDLDLSPWARVATPMAGIAHGYYFVPNFGDEVLVAFEHGDVNAPYILGSLWTALAPPPMPSPIPQIRTIRSPVGNQIIMAEVPPSIAILTPSGSTLTMAPDGINMLSLQSLKIAVGDNFVTITPTGVDIVSAKRINLNAGGELSIKAGGAVTIAAGSTCSITAPTIRLNS
jgi:hypothetical protein